MNTLKIMPRNLNEIVRLKNAASVVEVAFYRVSSSGTILSKPPTVLHSRHYSRHGGEWGGKVIGREVGEGDREWRCAVRRFILK